MLVKNQLCTAVMALLGVCGTTMAQVAVDGKISTLETPLYGAAKFLQVNPTSFDDNQPVAAGNPADVTRGIEIRIPKAAIGLVGANSSFKLFAKIGSGGYNFVSNQTTAVLPANSGNLAEVRDLDFQGGALAALPSVLSLTPRTLGAGEVVSVDGQLDATVYGTRVFTQGNFTGFGNASNGQLVTANGSEIDNLYVAQDATNVYLFVGGNLESNFNNLSIFFDTQAGGQDRLRGDNPNVDFNGLNRMGDSGLGNGLRFGAGFTADYWVAIKGGNTANGRTIFVQYASLASADGTVPGAGGLAGSTPYGVTDAVLTGGAIDVPAAALQISPAINNSNIEGVTGTPGGVIPSRDLSVGDEIDALYSYIAGTKLRVILTGNLNSSFTKLVLFFDTGADGQNSILANNVNIDFNRLNRMGENTTNTEEPIGPGLKFDAGFNASRFYVVTNGGSPIQQFGNAAVLRSTGAAVDFSLNRLDYGAFYGGPKNAVAPDPLNDPISFSGPRFDVQDGFTADLFANYAPFHLGLGGVGGTTSFPAPTPGLVLMSIDNNNTAGVSKTAVGNPGAVRTGVEYEFDLAELGYVAGANTCLKVAGWIASDGYETVSSQILGDGTLLLNGVNLTSNDPMGAAPQDIRNVDFSTISGNQFLVLDGICPPVTSTCLVDFNADGFLTQEDLGGFLTAFLDESIPPGPSGTNTFPCPGEPAPYDTLGYAADYNRDCSFNQDDLSGYITDYFGETENPTNCIPG